MTDCAEAGSVSGSGRPRKGGALTWRSSLAQARPRDASDSAELEADPPVPDDILAAFKGDFPGATDEEARQLASKGLRLQELGRFIGRHGGDAPAIDEYDRVSQEFHQLRTRVRHRAAPSLREPTANECDALRVECDAWEKKDHERQAIRLQEIINAILKVDDGAWAPHLETRPDQLSLFLQAGVERDVAAFRVLLCLSRGLEPGDGSREQFTSGLMRIPDPRSESLPKRQPGRPGRPAGTGVFSSDEDARHTITQAVRALTTPTTQATKSGRQ